VRRYLVVANQTLAGHHLFEYVRKCLAAGPCWFFVLVPATPIHEQIEWTADEARALARRRLVGALARFEAEGATATGAVGDPSPLRAVADLLREEQFEEIILSTLPAGTSRWLHQDLPTRLARVSGCIVTHLVAEGQVNPEPTALSS
jgi:GABA permease